MKNEYKLAEQNLDGTNNLLESKPVFAAVADGVQSLEYANLVKNMNGIQTTNGWDLIYSIRENKLNDVLLKYFNADSFLNHLSFYSDVSYNDFEELYQLTYYDLYLSPPKLSFSDKDFYGEACLNMTLDATKSLKTLISNPNKDMSQGNNQTITKYFTDNNSITVATYLKSLQGQTGEIAGAGEVVSFADNSKYSVVLHFKNAMADVYPESKLFAADLNEYFRNTDTYFELTTITNAGVDPTYINLTPKYFTFKTYSSGQDSVLSLYIQTQFSDQPGAISNINFPDDSKTILPIPSNYDVSFVLSYQLVKKLFNHEMGGYSVNLDYKLPTVGQSGFGFSAYNNKAYYSIEKSSSLADFGITAINYGDVEILNADNPLILEFSDTQVIISKPHNSQTTVSLWTDSTIPWGCKIGELPITSLEYQTKSNLDILIKKTFHFEVDQVYGIKPLSITFDQQDSWINFDFQNCNTWFAGSLMGLGCNICLDSNASPDKRATFQVINLILQRSVNVQLQAPEIDFKGISLLLTEQILVPEMSIKFDDILGVNIPLDMIIVGNLTDTSIN